MTMNSNMTGSALTSRAAKAAAVPAAPKAGLRACPKCHRKLVPEPDGSVFCVACVRPTLWGNLISIVQPSEGWQEIGWLLRGLLAAVFFALGVAGWAVALGGDGLGWWGLKGATGGVLLAMGFQALVAIVAAGVVRGFAAGRINRQIVAWCAAMVVVPALFAAARLVLS
jgi:hypothetical protein